MQIIIEAKFTTRDSHTIDYDITTKAESPKKLKNKISIKNEKFLQNQNFLENEHSQGKIYESQDLEI